MPPGVHPDGAAHRAGHPDRPLQAVEPGRHGAPGQHREADRGPGPDPVAVDGQRLEPGPEGDDQTGEAGVGHQHVRAPPEHHHRDLEPVESPGHRHQVILVAGFEVERRGAAHPVGGERPEGMVPSGPVPEGPLEPGQVAGQRRHRSAHQPGSDISSSGSEVRSPAPSVQQRSPADSTSPTARPRSIRLGV